VNWSTLHRRYKNHIPSFSHMHMYSPRQHTHTGQESQASSPLWQVPFDSLHSFPWRGCHHLSSSIMTVKVYNSPLGLQCRFLPLACACALQSMSPWLSCLRQWSSRTRAGWATTPSFGMVAATMSVPWLLGESDHRVNGASVTSPRLHGRRSTRSMAWGRDAKRFFSSPVPISFFNSAYLLVILLRLLLFSFRHLSVLCREMIELLRPRKNHDNIIKHKVSFNFVAPSQPVHHYGHNLMPTRQRKYLCLMQRKNIVRSEWSLLKKRNQLSKK